MLAIERGVPAIAPGAALLGGWLALALFGLPAMLPDWLAALLAIGVAVASIGLSFRRLRRIEPARPDELDRRLERASRLAHRPLAALADRPAPVIGADDGALWQAHLERSAAAVARLRTGPPVPRLAPIDRFGLRFAIPVALLAGLLVAREDAGSLVLASAMPGLVAAPGPTGTLAAWITPPGFTGLAPIFLHPGAARVADIPEGSVLSVGLTGSAAIPRVIETPAGRGRRPPFRRLGDASWQATIVLDADARVRIRQGGHAVADWSVSVTPSGRPLVAWNGKPGAYRDLYRTALPWKVSDRYGMDRLQALLRPVRPHGAPTIVVPIPMPANARDASGVEIPDLSASPFAGTEVEATLVGRDAAGVSASGPTLRFTLPTRPFHDPLARAVLDTRRRLALAPDRRDRAIADLEALGGVPHAFDRAPGDYLNLESVAALLRVDPSAAALAEAEARLWQLALAIEDRSHRLTGQEARTAIALRAARGAVDEQLARMRALGRAGQSPAEQAELGRRIEALKRALAQHLAALGKAAMKQGAMLPPDPSRSAMSGDAFKRMLDRLDEDARAGRMDEAARTLAQMEDMLDRMRPASPADIARAMQQMQADQAAQGQMRAVDDMIKRQSALLDHATRRAQAEQPGAPAPGEDAAQQSADGRIERALRRAADALSDQFTSLAGKKPDALGKASGAMQRARDRLAAGDDAGAGQAEAEALRDLQQGGKQMASTLASGRSGGGRPGAGTAALMPGFSSAGDGGAGGDPQATEDGDPSQAGRDPLGRSVDGNGHGTDDSSELALPEDEARRRARAIEEELRQRDSDRERPRQELDYLERLLNAF